jgi:hypothetical protein
MGWSCRELVFPDSAYYQVKGRTSAGGELQRSVSPTQPGNRTTRQPWRKEIAGSTRILIKEERNSGETPHRFGLRHHIMRNVRLIRAPAPRDYAFP